MANADQLMIQARGGDPASVWLGAGRSGPNPNSIQTEDGLDILTEDGQLLLTET